MKVTLVQFFAHCDEILNGRYTGISAIYSPNPLP